MRAHELTEPTGWNVEATIDLDGSVETVALDPAGGGLHGYGWTHIVPLNGAEDVFWQAAITGSAGAIHHSPCAMTRVWSIFADHPIRINGDAHQRRIRYR